MYKSLSTRTLLLTLLLSLIAAVPALAQEAEAPKLTATFLHNGEVLEGAFAGEETAQLYVFNATAGDVATISMTQPADSNLDPYIVLLGPRGEVLAADDDSGETTFSALISEVELPSDGTYFVLAASFLYLSDIVEAEPLAEEQTYELLVEGINEPVQEEASFEYFTGRLTFGDTVIAGEITEAEPVYYFVFEAKAGDVVNTTMESSDFDTVLHLFSTNGVRLAVNDDKVEGDTNSAIEGFTIPEDGVYLIFATNVFFYDDDMRAVGAFTISLN